jgi:hypothetical protein
MSYLSKQIDLLGPPWDMHGYARYFVPPVVIPLVIVALVLVVGLLRI